MDSFTSLSSTVGSVVGSVGRRGNSVDDNKVSSASSVSDVGGGDSGDGGGRGGGSGSAGGSGMDVPSSEYTIPSWKDLQETYEKRWLVKKAKFHQELTNNFRALIQRFATGKQEIFVLCVPERMEHAYKEAFLELFESGYAPHIGDVERLAGKRVRRLFITLPTSSLD